MRGTLTRDVLDTFDPTSMTVYKGDEEDGEFPDTRVVIGLGCYANEGEPDASIEINAWTAEVTVALKALILRALSEWGEQQVAGSNEPDGTDE